MMGVNDYRLGVYTKYSNQYPNGDKTQPITIVFKGTAVDRDLKIDGEETHDLQFPHSDQAPKLFNPQHNDILEDICQQRDSIYHRNHTTITL